MKFNVLGISGKPRKGGNTEILVKDALCLIVGSPVYI
jgi:multimeric flavodoxin WrbA